MERNDPRYQAYVEILKEELIPAMGCTEPIALAYAAAKAREVLGVLPDSVQLQVSGSIIKNVKSVIVPNTGHLKGMEAAVAAGIIAGSAEKELEVISEVSEEKKSAIRDYLQTVPITIEHTEQGHVFDIVVTERCGQDYARVRIADYHTNICRIEKNGTVLYEVPLLDETVQEDARADRSLLNMQDIWDFAETADLRDVADLLERQIRYNNAIAEEGLLGDYGANIGRVLLTTYGNDVSNRAKAKAAAGPRGPRKSRRACSELSSPFCQSQTLIQRQAARPAAEIHWFQFFTRLFAILPPPLPRPGSFWQPGPAHTIPLPTGRSAGPKTSRPKRPPGRPWPAVLPRRPKARSAAGPVLPGSDTASRCIRFGSPRPGRGLPGTRPGCPPPALPDRSAPGSRWRRH